LEKEAGIQIDKNHQRRAHLHRRVQEIGLELKGASTLKKGKKMVKTRPYRLLIIEKETAGDQIFDFCTFLRISNPYSILMVLGKRASLPFEEKLFASGVNDVVLGSQCRVRVLASRIAASLRYSAKPPVTRAKKVRLKDTIVDFNTGEVWCEGKVSRLRGIQPALLKYFLANPGRVVSRDELLGSPIWADSICSSARDGGKTFDVNISKLRKQIEPEPENPRIILSVRGKGWKLARDVIVPEIKSELINKEKSMQYQS